jgi:hypothetical protein
VILRRPNQRNCRAIPRPIRLPLYRKDGGCDVLEHPDLTGIKARPFWSPEALPAVLRLVPVTRGTSEWCIGYEPERWPAPLTLLDDAAGLHVIVGEAGAEHRLWLPDGRPPKGAALQAEIVCDAYVPERAAALLRFWRWVALRQKLRLLPKVTERQRRFARMLVAVDATRAGANYREVAELLLGVKRVASEWHRLTPLRDPIRTLVGNGRALVKGGYRLLLKPPRRHLPPPR